VAKIVLFVCGSLQLHSANRAALDVAREAILSLGLDVSTPESVSLSDIPALNPDHFEKLPPAVWMLRKQIQEADATIIAAPEYAGGLAGSLKNALDWCVGSTAGFYSHPVALISVGTSGGEFALRQLARTLLWQGAHLVDTCSVAGPREKMNGEGAIIHRPTIDAISALACRLLDATDLGEIERKLHGHEQARLLGIHEYPHMPGE
jgi:NAD(P)H-dependent FMN reductase